MGISKHLIDAKPPANAFVAYQGQSMTTDLDQSCANHRASIKHPDHRYPPGPSDQGNRPHLGPSDNF